LDFRDPIMGSLKSPFTTFYRSSIETIALQFFEKIAFFAFWRQTDRDKQTNEQMDSTDALSRSRCRERRLNKSADHGEIFTGIRNTNGSSWLSHDSPSNPR